MVKKEHIDLIGIATESDKHSKIILGCIEKDINLIIEKPIVLSLKDIEAISVVDLFGLLANYKK